MLWLFQPQQLMLAIDVGVGKLGEKRPTKLIPTSRGASTSCGASTFCGALTSRVSLWRHASQAHCLKYIKPKNLRSLNKSSHLHHCIVLYCSIAHWNISICYWTLRTAPSRLLLNYFPIIIVEKGTEYIKKISIRIAISSQYFEHYFGVRQHFSPFQLSRPPGRHPDPPFRLSRWLSSSSSWQDFKAGCLSGFSATVLYCISKFSCVKSWATSVPLFFYCNC